MKVLHLSDLHFQIGDTEVIRPRWNRLIEKIIPLKLDVVVFTGDLINRRSVTKSEDIVLAKELFLDLISKLEITNAEQNVIFIAGNHDLPYDPFANSQKNKENSNNGNSIFVDNTAHEDDWYTSFLSNMGLRKHDCYDIHTIGDVNILSMDLTSFLPQPSINLAIDVFAKDGINRYYIGYDKLLEVIRDPIFDDPVKVNLFIAHYPPSELSSSFMVNCRSQTDDAPYNIIKKKFSLYLCGHIHGFELFKDGFIARVGGTGGKFSAPPGTAEYAIYDIDAKNNYITAYKLKFDLKEQAVLELLDGRNLQRP